MNIQLSDHFTYRRLIRFVIPSVAMMILTSIYGVVDGLFVSNFVGKTAFAAVNLVIPFTLVLGASALCWGQAALPLWRKPWERASRRRQIDFFFHADLFCDWLGACADDARHCGIEKNPS